MFLVGCGFNRPLVAFGEDDTYVWQDSKGKKHFWYINDDNNVVAKGWSSVTIGLSITKPRYYNDEWSNTFLTVPPNSISYGDSMESVYLLGPSEEQIARAMASIAPPTPMPQQERLESLAQPNAPTLHSPSPAEGEGILFSAKAQRTTLKVVLFGCWVIGAILFIQKIVLERYNGNKTTAR